MAVDVTANSALLVWSTSPCSSVTGYAIYLANSTSTTDNPASQEFVANVTSRTTYYSLSNLNPGHVYYYRVRPYIDGDLNTLSRGTTVHTTPGKYSCICCVPYIKMNPAHYNMTSTKQLVHMDLQ